MAFENLKKTLDELTAWKIPGADIIVEKDGAELFRYTSGYSEIETKTPVKEDAIYYIFSATKPVIAVCAMKLIEEGRITLDTRAEEYLPSFKDIKVKQKNEDGSITLVPAKRPVTVRDLLSMSAGMNYNIESASIKRVREETDGRLPTVPTCDAMAREGLIFQPGEDYTYSLSIDVVGAIIEAASGMKLSEYVRTRITEPLGMDDTSFYLPEEKRARLAPLYIYNQEKQMPTRADFNPYILGSEYESGGAGLYSTTADMIKFCSMLANMGVSREGVRIISEKSIDEIRTPRICEKGVETLYKGWGYLKGYSYGLAVRTCIEPEKSPFYVSKGEFGWTGAAGALLLADPANKIAVYYSQHMRNSFEGLVHPKLKEAFYKDLGFVK